MRRPMLLLCACLALSAIAGCGNKGPLYYPGAPAPARTRVHTTMQAPPSASSAPASASSVQTQPLDGH